jgi:hypothetical protein
MALGLFVFLQIGDLLTTLVFLERGVHEGNPLVRAAMNASSPVLALAVVKLIACAVGVYAWRTRRPRVLRNANIFFAGCVCWNLLAIAVS